MTPQGAQRRGYAERWKNCQFQYGTFGCGRLTQRGRQSKSRCGNPRRAGFIIEVADPYAALERKGRPSVAPSCPPGACSARGRYFVFWAALLTIGKLPQ